MNIGLNNFATFPCFPLAFTRAKYPANDDETHLRLIKKYHRKPCESGHRSALPGLLGNRLEAQASRDHHGCLETTHSQDHPQNHSFQGEDKARTRLEKAQKARTMPRRGPDEARTRPGRGMDRTKPRRGPDEARTRPGPDEARMRPGQGPDEAWTG